MLYMALKRGGFLAVFCKISGFRVARALRVSLTLNQVCSAALARQTLRLCGSLLLVPTTVQLGRWLGSGRRAAYLKLTTRQLKIIQHHKVFVALAGWHPCESRIVYHLF